MQFRHWNFVLAAHPMPYFYTVKFDPKAIFLFFLAVVAFQSAIAQRGIFELSAGSAVSFATRKASDAQLRPVITPVASINIYKPITSSIAIKTGIHYQQKGLRSLHETSQNNPDDKVTYDDRTRLHYMSIPLQISLFQKNKGGKLWKASIGMNYGFLVYARTNRTATYFKNDLVEKEISTSFSNYVAASRSRDEQRGNDRSELYLFTPSLRCDVAYDFHPRFSVAGFYEYNLSDVSSNGGLGRINLHLTGLSINFRISQ